MAKKVYSDEELDFVDLETYMAVTMPASSSSSSGSGSDFVLSKDMSRSQWTALLSTLCDQCFEEAADRLPLLSTLRGPEMDALVVSGEYVTGSSLTPLTVFKRFHSLDVLDDLAAYHDMVFGT
jgi:hypothetical protein